MQHWEGGGHDQLCKKIKKAGGAEQYNANQKYAEAVTVAAEGVRGRHEGPGVLHLHTGPPLENEGGPRARVFVPRDGGVRARVVLGGGGEDFDVAEAEENNFLGTSEACEVEAVGLVQSVRAKIPRRRALCARVGVLEDVRGPAGGDWAPMHGDGRAWKRFIRCKTLRGRVDRERGRVVYETTPSAQRKKTFSSRRAILHPRMQDLDSTNEALRSIS